MKELIIFGAGDLAELASFYFERMGRQVVAYVVDDVRSPSASQRSKRVIPFEAIAKDFPPDRFDAFVAIGYSGMNEVRKRKFQLFKQLGYDLPSCVSPRAITDGAELGENCMVQEGVILQPFSVIADNCIIWAGSHFGHHSHLDAHCFLAPQVSVAGRVSIGERCFLGINSTVKDHVTLGERTLVAAGALVVNDTKPDTIVRGQKAVATNVTDWSKQRI